MTRPTGACVRGVGERGSCVAISRSWARRPTGSGLWQPALFVLSIVLIAITAGAAVAQAPSGWGDQLFRDLQYPRSSGKRYDHRSYQRENATRSTDVREGGARPEIKPVPPPKVRFPYDFASESIVISVTGKQEWPDWYPPAEMRERDPSLPEKMTGGIKNPLGAVALYLGNTLYRIHGTNDAKSIGRAESSGCFRMLNSAALHLASITPIGTPVAVVSALPKVQVSRAARPQTATVAEPVQKSQAPAPVERATSSSTPDYRTLREQMLRAD
jgi:hypothetical protein